MAEFFESVSTIFSFVIGQLSLIGEYITISIRALSYFVSIVNTLPLYFKAFVFCFVGVTVGGMILNRG